MLVSNFFSKYAQMSPVAKAAIWFTFCSFFQQGISLLTTPIFTRILSESDYGLVAVYNSWLGLLTVFCTLNLSGGVFNNGMVAYEKNRDKYVASMQGLSIIITAVIFAIYCVFNDFWDQMISLPPLLVQLMFIQILMIPPVNFWMVRQRFELKYRALVAITICMSVLTPILGILFITISSDKALGQIASFVLIQVVFGFLLMIYQFIKGKSFFDKTAWLFALKFNIPLLPHYLALMVLNQINRILINNYYGSAEAGLFSIAFSAANLIAVLISAVNATLVPWTYGKYKSNKHSEMQSVAVNLTTVMSCAMLLMVIIAPEIVAILAPESYYEAVFLIPPIAIGFLFTFVSYLTGTIEFYYESTGGVAIASVLCALLNLVTGIAVIPYFGYESAAYVTLICYILWSLMRFLNMKHILKKKNITNKPFSGVKVYSIIIIFSVMAFLVLGLYNLPFYIRYILVISMIIIAIILRKKILDVLALK